MGEVRSGLQGGARLAGDDEQGATQVETSLEGGDRLGVGGVQDVEGGEALGGLERGPEHLGAEAGTAHAEQHAVGEAGVAHPGGDRGELGQALLHRNRRVEPAQPVADHRGVGRVARLPQLGIAVPDPLDQPVVGAQAITGGQTPRHHRRAVGAAPAQCVDLLGDPPDQLVVGIGEGLHPGDQQVLGDLLHADADPGQVVDGSLGTLPILTHGVGLDNSVVAEGLDGGRRHGVDGVGTDQRLGVDHVSVVGVLGAGARPQRSLQVAAGVPQLSEGVAAEVALEGCVGEPGVGDRRPAVQAFEGGVAGVRLELLVEQLVDRGVHPADEEGGHRVDVERLAGGATTLQPLEVGLDHLLIRGEGEYQGDVDVDPGGDQLLDGGDPLGGGRHLDHEVGPVHAPPVVLGGGDAAPGVVGERRGQLQAHETVGTGGALVHRTQCVGRSPDVGDGQAQEDLVGILHPVVEQLVDLLVVVGAVGDRLLEDGGVAGHAGDVVLGDQPSQLRPGDQLAADVVEPHRLAALGEPLQGVGCGHQ